MGHFGLTLIRVESLLEGTIDLRVFLNLDPAIGNGYQDIRMALRIKANVTSSSRN